MCSDLKSRYRQERSVDGVHEEGEGGGVKQVVEFVHLLARRVKQRQT